VNILAQLVRPFARMFLQNGTFPASVFQGLRRYARQCQPEGGD
jgi:hypothetical protein